MSARACALQALAEVEEEARHARFAEVKRRLDLGRLKPIDRGLALELAQGVERTRILLDLVLKAYVARELPRDVTALSALRLGAYQLLFSTAIPAHAAVHETVAISGRARGFVNAVLRRIAGSVEPRAADAGRPRSELPLPAGQGGEGEPRTLVLPSDVLPDPAGDPAGAIAARHALPRALVQRWHERFGGAVCEAIARASSVPPCVFLRARLGLGASGLLEVLAGEGVETEPAGHEQLLRVTGGASPFDGEAFARGDFVAQDPTAFGAAVALDAQEGESVLDLCAAPGTKTTWVAECVGPGGRVVACDADAARLRSVRESAARLRLEQIEIREEPPEGELFDRVLVDAPCSNSGVLARRVEVRRRIGPDSIARLAGIQKGLLKAGCALARPGGHVLYSTCSIEQEENEAVVQAALPRGARIVEQRLVLPEAKLRDGGYWAMLRIADL
jgi:16S rRNA (cytosine967-C5)-methyltransferase